MNKLLVLILIFFPTEYLWAQTTGRIQKGNVRTQSYTGKTSSPVKGAIIQRKDGNVSPAISDSIGNFGLSMENIDTKDDVYYIGSVEVGDKSKKYKLFSPLPDDCQQYKPNSKLVIIMHSEAEWNVYMRRRMAETYSYYSKLYADSLAILSKKLENSLITLQEHDSISNKLDELRQNGPKLIEMYLQTVEAKTDFESLDSIQQQIKNAIYKGDLDFAIKELKKFGTFEEWYEKYISKRKAENEFRDSNDKDAAARLIIENNHIEIGLSTGNYEAVLEHMKNRLIIFPDNVDYLCELGQIEEIIYNLYEEAKTHYTKALEQAKLQNLSYKKVAICHNHLGDVYNALSDYTLAEEHYKQAGVLLEARKDGVSKNLFDSYLGLGNAYNSQAKFNEALSYYEKCVSPSVSSINRKAYLQGRIGIGNVKLAKCDYQGARATFSSVLKEIESIQDVDIVTFSTVYNNIITCMSTVGQYQEAIDSCDAAIKFIRKHSSPKNTYVANLLINKGNAYINIGKIREGEQCMNEAIDIYKKILGENHPNYASSCNMFANYYILVGNLKKSEEMSNKALGLFNEKFGKNHISTVASRYSRYELYKTYGEYNKALAELDTISAIYKSSRLLNDYNRIQINCCEAEIKIAQGEQPKGIKFFQEAIDCITQNLGRESMQLINIYTQMSMVYLEQRRNEKAKECIEKVQTLADKIFGKNSPVAIMQQIGMGLYYINKGYYHKAYELYSKIEKVAVEAFGADNHQLCGIYNMLGDYHLGQYNLEKAKYYYDKLYEITYTTYGKNHHFLAEPITKIGAYYMQSGDFRKGLEKEQQAYKIQSTHFGIGHKATLKSKLGICAAYIQLGQFDQAEAVLSKLSKEVEKTLGKNNSPYSSVLQAQATLYLNKGEFDKAIEYTEEAINIEEAIHEHHHSNTIQLYEQLSRLYSNMCNFSKAIEYNNVAISIATNYYGKDNIGLMPILLGKGQLCTILNKIKEAHELFNKIKNIYIKHLGDSCQQLNPVLISEAELLMHEGYYEQALEILKNVETQMISFFGENNFYMCSVYNRLGDAYQSIMQYKDARAYYQKSIDIIKNSLGDNNVNCIYPLVGLGNVCISEDATGQQSKEAYRLYNRASFISATVFGSNNANTASIDMKLGQISLRLGNLQDAYNKFQNYRTSVRQTLGDSVSAHPTVTDAHMNFGYYYIAKSNEASWKQDSVNTFHYALLAMKEFESAKKITEILYGKDHSYIANQLNAIAQTYLILQQPDSAIATYIKAAELQINQFGKNSPFVAQAYAILGATCKYESDNGLGDDEEKLNNAKDYYIKAITIRENSKGNSKEILMTSTMNWRIELSAIYMKLYDYENAFKTIDKVINEAENLQLENKFLQYNCFCIKASMIVESNQDPEEAFELLTKANELFPQLTFPNDLMKISQHSQLLLAFGTVYEKMDLANEAIKCYESAYEKLRVLINNSQVDTMKQILMDKIEELRNNN